MQIEVKVFRLFRLGESIEHFNWVKGVLFMKTDSGNVPLEISHRHKSWWLREFDLSEEDFNQLISK